MKGGLTGYVGRHEASVRERLWAPLTQDELSDLLDEHLVKISWLQHERLVHLLVTMLFALILMLLVGFLLLLPTPGVWLLVMALLVLGLLVAYVLHYFRLENSVQRWYALADEIRTRMLEETEG
ncbi:MAG TPA: hypothetical protein DCM45_05435 [Clostridiales bacterium]|nr:hypothetical protein [Clostridiales bacterium]